MKKFGTAVILAGGKSTRMGFDKQLLKINERRLIDHLKRKLYTIFSEIIVVTNRSDYYLGYPEKITKDIIVGKGPLSGIHAGLHASSSFYAYFVACDMPNINLKYIAYMKNQTKNSGAKACVTRFGEWIEPFNAFYSKDMLEKIEDHLKDKKRSVNSLLRKVDTCYIEEDKAREYSPNWEMFLNLNTKEELKNYLRAKDKQNWGRCNGD